MEDNSSHHRSAELLRKVAQLEAENEALRRQVQALRQEQTQQTAETSAAPLDPHEKVARLTNPEIARYGRQLILPDFGIHGKCIGGH